MESSKNTQLKVGLFLVIGIAVILTSIFFLGADKAIFTDYVKLNAHFDQVQGLAPGSIVSLSGVTVGNVEEISFLPEANTLNVKMKINKNFIQRVRQGSQVEIRTQGALGDKFVFIIPGDPRNDVVKDGDNLEVAKATDILGVIAERGGETTKIFDIINDLHKMIYSMTSNNRMEKLMTHLESATGNLDRASQQVNKFTSDMNSNNAGEKLAHSATRLEGILAKIDQGQGTLGALINDPTLHQQVKSYLGAPAQQSNVKTLLRSSIKKQDK